MAKTILIADDDMTVTKLFHLDVEGKDIDMIIRSSNSGEETITSLAAHKPDLLILDIRMPKGDGFSVLEHMAANNLDIPVIILTNYRNEQYIEKSKTYGNVKTYIVKHETRMDRVIETVNSYLA